MGGIHNCKAVVLSMSHVRKLEAHAYCKFHAAKSFGSIKLLSQKVKVVNILVMVYCLSMFYLVRNEAKEFSMV